MDRLLLHGAKYCNAMSLGVFCLHTGACNPWELNRLLHTMVIVMLLGTAAGNVD